MLRLLAAIAAMVESRTVLRLMRLPSRAPPTPVRTPPRPEPRGIQACSTRGVPRYLLPPHGMINAPPTTAGRALWRLCLVDGAHVRSAWLGAPTGPGDARSDFARSRHLVAD